MTGMSREEKLAKGRSGIQRWKDSKKKKKEKKEFTENTDVKLLPVVIKDIDKFKFTRKNIQALPYLKAVVRKLKRNDEFSSFDIKAIRHISKIWHAWQLPHFFTALQDISKSPVNKNYLFKILESEIGRRNEATERWREKQQKKKAPGNLRRTSIKRKKEHIQKTIFDQIRLHPEMYYSETPGDCRSRIEAIKNAMGDFDDRVRKYAEFNIKFFSTLASEERSFKPIKLPYGGNYFRWPDTEVIHTLRNTGALDIDAEGNGVLSMLGYNARLDGPTEAERRKVLDDLFNGNLRMPMSLPEQYVIQWGEANSVIRLRKLAYSIASFTRQQKRKRNASVQAVEKWEADLEYLRGQYYKPFSSHFGWPSM